MLSRRSESGRDEERSYLISVKADGVGLIIDPRPTDVDCRRVGDEAFFFGVTVEAGHGAQTATDRGRGPAPSFQLPSVSPVGQRLARREPLIGDIWGTCEVGRWFGCPPLRLRSRPSHDGGIFQHTGLGPAAPAE